MNKRLIIIIIIFIFIITLLVSFSFWQTSKKKPSPSFSSLPKNNAPSTSSYIVQPVNITPQFKKEIEQSIGAAIKKAEENRKKREEQLKKKDQDGDRLPDDLEVDYYHTDPRNPDTDGDGLNDFQELAIYGTDPLQKDTDGDGRTDKEEVDQKENPRGEGELHLLTESSGAEIRRKQKYINS